MSAKVTVYVVERCLDYQGCTGCTVSGVFGTTAEADAYVESKRTAGRAGAARRALGEWT